MMIAAPEVVDEQDFVLLRLLRANARTAIAELAVAAGLAPSMVHERIRKLERRGVIRRWTVDVNPAEVGLGVTAFVGIECAAPAAELAAHLRDIEGIEECHCVCGALTVLVKARARDHEALLGLVERVRQLPGVRRAETSVVLRTEWERGPEPPTWRNGTSCRGW